MLNSVSLVGRVGQDAECQAPNRPVSFSISTWESFKKKDSDEWETKTTWHDVVVWGSESYKNSILDRAKKGKYVALLGKIQVDTFPDKDTGKNRKSVKIVATSVKLWDGKKSEDSVAVASKPTTAAVSAEPEEEVDLPF